MIEMQAGALVELAGVVAVHGRQFVRGQGRLSRAGVRDYWVASKTRFDRWMSSMNRYRHLRALRPAQWRNAAAVIEEIFATEILTRVWTATACECDRRHGGSEASPLVRSTLLGHMDARNRALRFLSRIGEQRQMAVEANRVRSRSERWTDLLLAHLLPDCSVDGYAFQAGRTLDFANDLPDARRGIGGEEPTGLLQASLRAAFAACKLRTENADLNERIAAGVGACFGAEQLESISSFRSIWMQRLSFTADDATNLVEELLMATE